MVNGFRWLLVTMLKHGNCIILGGSLLDLDNLQHESNNLARQLFPTLYPGHDIIELCSIFAIFICCFGALLFRFCWNFIYQVYVRYSGYIFGGVHL